MKQRSHDRRARTQARFRWLDGSMLRPSRCRALSVAALPVALLLGTACSDDGPEGSTGGGTGGAAVDGGFPPGTGGNPSGGSNSGSDAASGGSASGDDSGSGGSGGTPLVDCDDGDPVLDVERLEEFGAVPGSPFDTDGSDLSGPTDWGAQYGKEPEIVPFVSEQGLDVLYQDQNDEAQAFVVHVESDGDSYGISRAYRVESLGQVMGLTKDASGNYYVATGVDEDDQITEEYPSHEERRPDIVRLVGFDVNGCVFMESDVDVQRGAFDMGSEILVNPMTAGTSRLVWGNDRLMLLHAHNTDPDDQGTRHQKAIATQFDAATGAVTRASTMWVSHSFDQRLLFEDGGFIEMHLGDAYPRQVVLGKYSQDAGSGGYAVYHNKGAEGANNTYTRLGSIVPTDDAEWGYLVLLATERSTSTGGDLVAGTRDVALVRVAAEFASEDSDELIVDDGMGTTTQTVTQTDDSGAQTVNNHLRWLTDLGEDTHAERPRLVRLNATTYVALFETWTTSGGGSSFVGTSGLVVDADGNVTSGITELTTNHLSRGDDAVAFDGQAVFVTGDGSSLQLNLVSPELSYSLVDLSE